MPTRQSASYWNQNINEITGSQNSTYLRHHVTEVLLLVAKLLFLSRFFIPVALSEEDNSVPFWLGRRKKKKQPTISTEQRHQAKWSLLGCQNIIHGFQFLGLDGDVHLVWLLILKQIHLPPNLTEVKKKINYQLSGKRPSSKEHPKGYSSNTHPFRSWWFILCSQHIPVKRAHMAWDTKPRGDMQEVLGLGRHTYGLTHIVSQGRSFLPFVQEPSEAKEGTSATNTNKDTTNPTNTTNIYLPGTMAVLPASQSPSSAASEGR